MSGNMYYNKYKKYKNKYRSLDLVGGAEEGSASASIKKALESTEKAKSNLLKKEEKDHVDSDALWYAHAALGKQGMDSLVEDELGRITTPRKYFIQRRDDLSDHISDVRSMIKVKMITQMIEKFDSGFKGQSTKLLDTFSPGCSKYYKDNFDAATLETLSSKTKDGDDGDSGDSGDSGSEDTDGSENEDSEEDAPN